MKTLIEQGAEANIFKENNLIIKERIPKDYRLKELDEKIRKQRTKREISILNKALEIIPVPKITKNETFFIEMEFIDGLKLSVNLDKFDNKKRKEVCKLIGKQVALLHNKDIIHGDLTTSNMILKNTELYFIDFGLSFIDIKPEHKAVDLHLLRQALESKHHTHYESSFKEVIKSYKEYSNNSEQILSRLELVEKRGRYKNKQ